MNEHGVTPSDLAGRIRAMAVSDARVEPSDDLSMMPTGTLTDGRTFLVSEGHGGVEGGADEPMREPLALGIYHPAGLGEPEECLDGLTAEAVLVALARYMQPASEAQ
jgi:hypothetical protein